MLAGPGEEAREPAYCIRCGVGFLVAILLDIDRETHEYSLVRRGCVRRRSPLVSLRATSFYVYIYVCRCVHGARLTHIYAHTHVHRHIGNRYNVGVTQTERERSLSRRERNTRTRFDHEGEARVVVSVGSLSAGFPVRGGGDYLENGDAGSAASRPSFIYREQRVEWREGEVPGCVSRHYILLHCVQRCSYPSQGLGVPVDVPLSVWLHLNCTLLSLPLYTDRPRPPSSPAR